MASRMEQLLTALVSGEIVDFMPMSRNEVLLKQLIDQGGTGGGGGTTPDWNATEGEPGHVLNRTHWVEANGVIMEESDATATTHPTFGKMWFVKYAPYLEVGQTYTVIYNGTPYECTCQKAPSGLIQDADAVALGNFSVIGGANTGEPFAMLISFAYQEIDIIDLIGSEYVRVAINGSVYHKMHPEFMPDSNRVVAVKFVESSEGNLISLSHTYLQIKNALMRHLPVFACIHIGYSYLTSPIYYDRAGVMIPNMIDGTRWEHMHEYDEFYLDGDISNKTIGNEVWLVVQ